MPIVSSIATGSDKLLAVNPLEQYIINLKRSNLIEAANIPVAPNICTQFTRPVFRVGYHETI